MKYKLLIVAIFMIFSSISKAELVYQSPQENYFNFTESVKKDNSQKLKRLKISNKNNYYKKSPERPEAGKFYRLPLFISSLALIFTGALLIFLAFNTIGYLGFIMGVIGIILMIVWLIFYEGEKIIK